MLDKFETFQKRCVKWILSEEYYSYNSFFVYLRKCRQVNLLPITKRFDLNDLILFHKTVYNLIPLKMPDYLSFFNGLSRLRSCHLDSLSFVSTLQPRNASNVSLNKSFFYRTHTLWNALPLEIRQIESSSAFKNEVIKHLWKLLLMDCDDENADFDPEVCLSDID